MIEKQKALISNLESLKAEQKKTLTEVTEEMSAMAKREKEATDRAQQISKALSKRSLRAEQLEGEVEQLKIRLNHLKSQPHFGGAHSHGALDDDVSFLRMKARKYDDRMKCSICNEREKDTILQSCLHMFCSDCVQKNYKSRNRKCDIDGLKFTEHDIKKIAWGENDVI